MSRFDCISNRHARIIAGYVTSKLGHYDSLFEGLPYPTAQYPSPDDFFLDEDEWTTYENFQNILRKAKKLVGERWFYFNCGASSAALEALGRLRYFVRVFSGPGDGFKRLPFFNRNLNDTKDIDIIVPPVFDKSSGKIKTLLKVKYHDDFDVHRAYIDDPYLRGILCAIPTIWGFKPATIRQPLVPYDPEILFNEEPEFISYNLDVRMRADLLTMKDPHNGQRQIVGKKVLIRPESINGDKVFLGKYSEFSKDALRDRGDKREAILITRTVQVDNRILMKAGEIFKAPYFILRILYDRPSFQERLSQVFKVNRDSQVSGKELVETINQLRETIGARNRAYQALEKANAELREAKTKVEEYAETLEQKVEERTTELRKAKEEVMRFNRDLKSTVDKQVRELERYNALRRYLSPKLTEKILSTGDILGAETQRKMMTVLFSDIRNFSAITDSLEPEEVFELLDKYLSEMTRIVHQYDGTLNKIIGDGLLVFLGDPIAMYDHARRAVMMAIDMQKSVVELRHDWLQYGYELAIGIGINTGYMNVGNIGSESHKDYTVIGNQVNVASRLVALAKPGQILISQRTYSRVRDFVSVKSEGEIRVKGMHNPVPTYSVEVF